MARKDKDESQAVPTFTDTDKARARQWFKKAEDCRERREYDYAIECYITGLGYWTEAVEEGHMPLRSLAIQRQQAGGKKPGLMDSLKKSMIGREPKKGMLNAEHLLALDPANASYADGLVKNANKAGFLDTCKWVAPIVQETLRKDKKPNKGRFHTFRQTMIEAAEKAVARDDSALETWLLEQAVNSLDYLAARLSGDEEIRKELQDLAGRLTIARGKYEQAEDFHESLLDAEKQKRLHDSERMHQSEDSYEALVEAARREWEQAPEVPGLINAYVDVLLKPERKKEEDVAIDVLMKTFEKSNNYSFKLRADDVRLRQMRRQVGRLVARARKTKAAEDKQQARLAALEQRQLALEVFRERVEKYPTDLRLKYKLGTALFDAGEYDEAIPVLQVAQQDPRSRVRCQLQLGRAFFEKGSPGQAAEVLRESLEKYELTDELSKELLYWLGRSYEAAEKIAEAKDAYGKLLRQDYNYKDGDARQRLDALK
ncbi:MAG: hypothetical protein KAY37_08050 [Phycisphaerae bacterium]|nr:hypothetical protein [Phycisphaerae bacterium]